MPVANTYTRTCRLKTFNTLCTFHENREKNNFFGKSVKCGDSPDCLPNGRDRLLWTSRDQKPKHPNPALTARSQNLYDLCILTRKHYISFILDGISNPPWSSCFRLLGVKI